MYRSLMASTAIIAITPALSAAPISTPVTAPVQTSTANAGAPGEVSITKDGSVTITGGGTAVRMDTNHNVSNAGNITVNNANGAHGIVAIADTTGNIVNTGNIEVAESYTPTDTDNDGDLDGPFAIGNGRYGIRTLGAHTGNVVNDGKITVEGNYSAGIWLGGTLTGNFTHNGTTTVVGEGSTAIRAEAINGNVRLAGTVSATGAGAVAAQFTGDVNGTMEVQGNIKSTGYRYTTSPTDPSKLDADDLLQGGSALMVEGNVTGGIRFAIAPKDTNAANKDEDGDGIDDDKEGNASILTYGAAPAVVIGSASRDITIGEIANSASKFGILVDGKIAGHGVYAGVDGNGMLIGGRGGSVTIANGIGVAGEIAATSRDSDATALRFGSGASTPQLQNSGTISSVTGNTTGAISTAIRVDAGANLPTIRNSGTIKATAGEKATAIAIVDASGTVTLVENSGAIVATGAKADSGRNIAIDLSANTTGVTLRQTQVGAGVAAPSIEGNIRLGSGNDLFSVADGKVVGDVTFGGGNDTFNLSGDAVVSGKATFGAGNDVMSLLGTSIFSGTVDFGGGSDTLTLGGTSRFSGSVLNAGGLAVTVNGGVLDIRQPATLGSLNLGKDGVLLVTLNPASGDGTALTVTGNAVIEKDATLGIILADVHDAEGRYVVLSAGTLTGASGLKVNDDFVPFMFKATVANNAGPNQLAIDVARRTTTELGLNLAQSAAYDAVVEALANDEDLEEVFLAITDADYFRYTVGQMLPDHAGGAFLGVSQGIRAFSRQLNDPIGPVYQTGDFNLTLNAAGWGADKDEGESAAIDLNGLGLSATGAIETDLGAFGVSATWLWNEYSTGNNKYNNVLSNTYELAAHWLGKWGGFSAFGRGSIGKADFEGKRIFAGKVGDTPIEKKILRDWGGTVTSFTAGASMEGGWRYFFFRPQASVDYIKLSEDGYTEDGGDEGLPLTVESRSSDELAVNGGVVLGIDFVGMGQYEKNWFRVEGEGGWREVVAGKLGSTTAHFEDGESFTLDPEQSTGGWYASLKAMGGNSVFTLLGELGLEDRLGGTAYTVRGSLRFGF
ncbi:autotransporter domain-containing protein [Altererythrobacter sp. Z27]|uniref:autotransporter domain-containing protein n=1 Tax=Altererythrobacter sp. Z27 TaxID=3461147 RepID=UPI004044268A